jgi:predicted component of type VI protein secretion system
MSTLVLEWIESNGGGSQTRTQNISDTAPTRNSGTFRIGRDRSQCDLEINHNTVSRLHIEIGFYEAQQSFFLRNLAPNNAPTVDGQRVTYGEVPLRQGSSITLGQVIFNVVSIEESLARTVVVSPPDPREFQRGNQHQHQQQYHPQQHQHHHQQHQHHHQHQHHPQQDPAAYGLECPRCRQVSDYSYLNIGCRWCGTSLGAAASVLVVPKRT